MEKALCTKMFNIMLYIKARQPPKCPIVGGWLSEPGCTRLVGESVPTDREARKECDVKYAYVVTNAEFKRQESEFQVQNN